MQMVNLKPKRLSHRQVAEAISQFGSEEAFGTAFATVMRRVYGYMFMGLIATALVAFWVSGFDAFWDWYGESAWGVWVILWSPLLLLFVLLFVEQFVSHAVEVLLFLVYSAVFGFSIAVSIQGFTTASVFSTFIVTCLLFGAMSVYGLVTKRCLASWGSFLFAGLIGLIIAMVVNIFIMNDGLSFVISLAGIAIFMGLTAYDTKTLKETLLESPSECKANKVAIQGALLLYLNFIILFLRLLRLKGKKN